jgi:hypothetical protein
MLPNSNVQAMLICRVRILHISEGLDSVLDTNVRLLHDCRGIGTFGRLKFDFLLAKNSILVSKCHVGKIIEITASP